MDTLAAEFQQARVQHVVVTEESLTVELTDGRTVSVPLAWYPRLLHGSRKERNHWRVIAKGEGIHWPDLDEDISVENLLLGQPSGESQTSFRRWVEQRRARTKGGRLSQESSPTKTSHRTPQKTRRK